MCAQRIVNNILKTVPEFDDGDIVDIADISVVMKRLDGRIRWSKCEIAGAMPKLKDIFEPTGEKNKWNLNTYTVRKKP